MSPFFSICIPTYNCGDIVYKALSSVARQTFDDWEVVVLDDGSTDDTACVCGLQSVIPSDRFRLVRAEHGGQLRSRLRLLAESRGEVIISLDADDELIGEDALEKIWRCFVEQGCDIVMFNATRSLETMSPFVDYSTLDVDGSGIVDLASARRLFCSDYALNNVAFKAYRRTLLNPNCSVPSLHMTEDRWQCADLFVSCKSLALIDEPLYFYRLNPSSVTGKKFTIDFFRDQITVERRVSEVSGSWGLSETCRDAFLLKLFFNDLCTIRELLPVKSKRLSLYSQIAGEEGYRVEITPLDRRMLRLDRSLALWLFSSGSYGLLDAYLGVRCSLSHKLKDSA